MATSTFEEHLTDRKFELLVQSVTDYAIYMLDAEGRIVTWNPGAERFKGYTADEVTGEHFSRFFTREDQEAELPARALRIAAREGRFEAEGWRVRKDGTRFWAHAILDPIRAEDGTLIGYAKITRDISERKERERALHESERRFQLLVGSVEDYAIYMLDPHGLITTWNAGARRFKGYEADEIMGEHFSKFFVPEDRRDGLPSRILKTAAEQKRFEMEGWRLRKDGTRFLAHVVVDAIHDEEGALVGFAKITRDITEKRRLEESTFASALQFRLLVQGVRDYAIYMLDTAGRITSWNSGARAIKGYEEEEVLGKHFSRFYTEEDRARGAPAAALEAALRDGKFEAEAQRVRKDGSLFWAHVLIDPIYNEDGEHVGFAKITRDVSEKKRSEQELRVTQEALLQSQKLQALGELAGGIAHDFNNLMTVMRGSADFLLRQPDLPLEKRNRYLHVMLETAERATSLTSQLLTFARRQPLEPEVIDLSVRLDALGEMLQRTLGSLYDLQLDLAPALWHVEIDPAGLEAALLNAVVNARDAMPNGGRITVSTRNVSGPNGEGVTLSISDTGEGISPEQLQRVFEPFFTTKPTGKGTGLGLSQIHGYAVQSGGSAKIQSEVGHGTTVEIWLPRTSKAAPRKESVGEHTALPQGLRVLLVEDSDHVRYFAHQLLDDLGCNVVEAANGSEALSRLEETDVDLVFSDIVMPGMSGLDLAQRIRETRRGLPVLLASGYSSKQFIPKDQREFPILRKPYKLETLAAGIHQLVAPEQTTVSG
ncbi:hybrid sensor histidine kinase/response regulator [Allosphingosinicella deserti]|uniref:histidine kinase n=1 Tax=Allosphingosinicella deserti TaxID=2116704 RepID=A0A2P7QVV1_9SPHN|nr:PAS domain-containing sensor histidine kinase [Sphingomonas deserti]PSJ42102.1 hybrid sensor histidine kinase/response regulator [Sphingomonas deserti]